MFVPTLRAAKCFFPSAKPNNHFISFFYNLKQYHKTSLYIYIPSKHTKYSIYTTYNTKQPPPLSPLQTKLCPTKDKGIIQKQMLNGILFYHNFHPKKQLSNFGFRKRWPTHNFSFHTYGIGQKRHTKTDFIKKNAFKKKNGGLNFYT